ncbi:pyridoxamine 5'-phosphate oxidase family protein [Marivita sp. S2033]|uniref:pyridoxamine 5'-phosphate oxidase family protein n=1 Tax=Marivita sp. S2033 TaxID=3373187 RepID=UPI003981F774
MTEATALGAFLDAGWHVLAQGLSDTAAAARHPVLATVSPNGWPEARTVVLRGADRREGVIEIHTDGGSSKIASLKATPRAQLHIWDATSAIQLRLSTSVTLRSGPAVADRWRDVPDDSRMAYGASPATGTAIPTAGAYEKRASFDSFTVMFCHIVAFEIMQLSDPHKRAVFKGDDGWKGSWIVP